MRKIIFLLLIMFTCIEVHAKESFYYDSEMVGGMWITKEKDGEEKRSAHPLLIKREKDNTYVFCLEPFTLLVNGAKYEQDNDYKKYGLTKEQFDRINLIAYYGYGYKKHTSKKWYGVTQYLIWKEADKKAKIYFSSTQFGKKEDLFTDEINEIENLILEHNKEFEIEKKYKITTDEILTIESNINLDDYKITTDMEYTLDDNKIIVSNLSAGTYKVKLEKIMDRFANTMMLYQNSSSQDVILPGFTSVYDKEYEFEIVVEEGTFTFTKESSTTNERLGGAIYGIYKDGKLVTKIKTSKNKDTMITLPIGKYIVKELKAPPGYKLDTKEYEFEITYENLDVEVTLTDDKIVVNVPPTGLVSYKRGSALLIIIGCLGLLYDKKKYKVH